MRIVAATKNPGKLRELRDLFAPYGWVVEVSERYVEAREGEVSYADNAAVKAEALRRTLAEAADTAPVVGDDSGIEVAALGGVPGVLSARYGGDDLTWEERRARLLAALDATNSGDRRARFVCALHYIDADGGKVSVQAYVNGTIAHAEHGDGGFSYDPIFVYPPFAKTFAQLTEREKNGVSHRGMAVHKLMEALRKRTNERIP